MHGSGKDSCKKVPRSQAKGDAQHNNNPPWRDIQAFLYGEHVGMGCECPDRYIRDEVTCVHHAEKEHKESQHAPSPLFGCGVEVSGQQVKDAIAEENSSDGDQRRKRSPTRSEDGIVIDILIDIPQSQDVVQTQMSIVECQRIRFIAERPRDKRMSILMHQIPQSVGKPEEKNKGKRSTDPLPKDASSI